MRSPRRQAISRMMCDTKAAHLNANRGVDSAVEFTQNCFIRLDLPDLTIHEKGFSSSLTINPPSLQQTSSLDLRLVVHHVGKFLFGRIQIKAC